MSSYKNDRILQLGTSAGVTDWLRLTAAAMTGSADPSTIFTSITDTGGYLSVVASALASGTAYPQPCYEVEWDVIDPDTGRTVDWSAGDYLGVQVWLSFVGSNYPSTNREACWIGIGNPSTDAVLVAGIYQASAQLKLGAALWSAADKNTITWGADDIVYGDLVVAPVDGSSNVLISYGSAMQMDEATSPARVASSLAGSLSTTAASGLKILGYFAGNVDVKAYYRLVRIPASP